MFTDYWIEIELWKQRQNRLDKMANMPVVEKSQSKLIVKIMAWMRELKMNLRQELQAVQSPTQKSVTQSKT